MLPDLPGLCGGSHRVCRVVPSAATPMQRSARSRLLSRPSFSLARPSSGSPTTGQGDGATASMAARPWSRPTPSLNVTLQEILPDQMTSSAAMRERPSTTASEGVQGDFDDWLQFNLLWRRSRRAAAGKAAPRQRAASAPPSRPAMWKPPERDFWPFGRARQNIPRPRADAAANTALTRVLRHFGWLDGVQFHVEFPIVLRRARRGQTGAKSLQPMHFRAPPGSTPALSQHAHLEACRFQHARRIQPAQAQPAHCSAMLHLACRSGFFCDERYLQCQPCFAPASKSDASIVAEDSRSGIFETASKKRP